MGIFFEKPTKGPDVVGGIWPIKDRARVWNRCGAARVKGEIVQLALTQGEATEIATNDANSYIPGASNDTVWNTIIDPISSTTTGSSKQRGAIWAVVTDDVISDNKAGMVCTFGIVDAYVSRSNTTSANPGSPLTVYASNVAARLNTLNPRIVSNDPVVATLLGFSNAALTTRRLRKILLHQGLFFQAGGIAGGFT